jgi:hypothetical protein
MMMQHVLMMQQHVLMITLEQVKETSCLISGTRSNLTVDHQMGKVANQHMLEQRENLEMVLKQVAIDLLHTLNSL